MELGKLEGTPGISVWEQGRMHANNGVREVGRDAEHLGVGAQGSTLAQKGEIIAKKLTVEKQGVAHFGLRRGGIVHRQRVRSADGDDDMCRIHCTKRRELHTTTTRQSNMTENREKDGESYTHSKQQEEVVHVYEPWREQASAMASLAS